MDSGDYWGDSRRFRLAVLALAVLALLTRLWGLGHWPLDGDEIITFRRGSERLWGFFSPAYYWLWAISDRLLGPSEFSVRFPSALFGAIAIPAFAITWRHIVGNRAALLGASAVLLSGWHVAHSQWGRYYACAFFFASLSYYYYCRAIKEDSSRNLVMSAALGGVAALFHPSAAAVPAACFVATLVLWSISQRFAMPPIGRKVLRTHVFIAIAGLVIGAPIVISILNSWAAEGLAPIGAPLMAVRFAKYAEVPTLLLAMAGWLVAIAIQRQLAVILAVAVGVPLILALGAAEFIGMREDYLFFVVPLLMVGVGVFLDRSTQLPVGVLRAALAGTVLALFLPTFVSHYLERMTLDVRDAVRYVQGNWREGDQTLSFSGSFRFYAPGSLGVIEPEALRPPNMRDKSAPQGGWNANLAALVDRPGRTWIIIRQTREPKYPELSRWLGDNAHLVWRRYATRLDEEVDGFEIWRVDSASSVIGP
jgi:hypothetical protein